MLVLALALLTKTECFSVNLNDKTTVANDARMTRGRVAKMPGSKSGKKSE